MSYYTDEFVELKTLLGILWDCKNYKYVYVSIGGKLNEYEFAMPYSDKMINMRSNAHLQLCPSFLCDRKTTVLMICIDKFEKENDEKINREVCKGFLQRNMDIIFYNLTITFDNIGEFITYFINVLDYCRIQPENFIICNYIRFLNSPNMEEMLLEGGLSEKIYKLMHHSKYRGSLYQWFGYHPNLYNIIFNFNQYYTTYLSKFSQLTKYLETNYETKQITSEFASKLQGDIKKCPLLDKFMNCVVDISSYYHGDKMADRLSEWV